MPQTSQDLKKGIDVTGLEEFTASEFNQLVDAGRLADDKGMRIVTTDTAVGVPDVPNPDVELEGVIPTFWTRYKWVRVPNIEDVDTKVKEYNWNPNLESDATYLKWELSFDAEGLEDDLATLTQDVSDATVLANTANVNANNALTLIDATTVRSIQNSDSITTLQNKVNALDANKTEQDNRLDNLESADTEIRSIEHGGTGSNHATGARSNLGMRYTPVGHVFLKDRKDTGVNGGDFTSGAWQGRALNEKAGNVETHVTLNGDGSFNLVRGNYIIKAKAPAYGVNNHQARLSIWDGAAWIPHTYGSSEWSNLTDPTQTSSIIIAVVSLNATFKLRIEHRAQDTILNNGMGVRSNFGGFEYYTQVEIEILSQ